MDIYFKQQVIRRSFCRCQRASWNDLMRPRAVVSYPWFTVLMIDNEQIPND